MSFFEFPNTRTYDKDLGWVISEVKRIQEIVDTFVYASTLKFADPILWNITTQYEKSTIVLDPSGNAYLSKDAVPSGIQLNNTDYWLEIFNFTEYTRTANRNLTVNVETNTTRATQPYVEDDWVIWDDVLYRVTSDIAIDDTFIVAPAAGANIIHFTVEDFIKAWMTATTALINQYKDDIDASEAAYRLELAQDIATTTASLQAQLDAAIAGATVDSEVINARIGADGVTYPTLGDAIRQQITHINESLDNADIIAGDWQSGYLDLSGTSVDISSPTASSNYVYCIIPCTFGDIFVVTSEGASSARNWAKLSSASGANNIISKAPSPYSCTREPVTPSTITQYMVFNAKTANPYNVIKFNLFKRVLSLSYAYSPSLANNTDFNNITNIGNYRIETYSSAQTMQNIPIYNGSKYAGRLIVLTINSASATFQLYISNSNDISFRLFSGGAWTSWRTITDDRYAIANLFSNAKSIAANSDIDDITTGGNYYVSSVATARTISNLPVTLGGRLTVLTLNSVNALHQWYISSGGDWYIRERVSNVWQNWKHLIDEDYIIEDGNIASKSAYNALQPTIRSAPYNIAYANAYIPLKLKNYLGNTQNVHPKVLYFNSGFAGHNYWMAYTPYPYSNDKFENPCIAYSDDGFKWVNINANPLDDPNGNGYDSDTDLIYNPVSGLLECWYRWVSPSTDNPRREVIYRQTSNDGLNWSTKEIVFDNSTGDYANLLSPAVIVDDNKYKMWVVQSSHSPVSIDYYESPINDMTNWTKLSSVEITASDRGSTVRPWHIDVIKDNSEFVILGQFINSTDASAKCSLFVFKTTDSITYTTPIKIVQGADSWDKHMYRSSILKINGRYRIYYSAGSGGTVTIYSNAVWGLGITESDTLNTGYFGYYE